MAKINSTISTRDELLDYIRYLQRYLQRGLVPAVDNDPTICIPRTEQYSPKLIQYIFIDFKERFESVCKAIE